MAPASPACSEDAEVRGHRSKTGRRRRRDVAADVCGEMLNWSTAFSTDHNHVTLLPDMDTPRWHIRAASVDDVPALVSLVQGYWEFEQIPGFDKPRVEAALCLLLADLNMAAAWVALADSAFVGYLLAVYVFSLEHLGLTAEIDEFYVLPAHRHSGVGTALLQSAEAFSRRPAARTSPCSSGAATTPRGPSIGDTATANAMATTC